MDRYISLIGLGAVGAPLGDLLWKKYKDDFALLSSESFLRTLENLYINGLDFNPTIIHERSQLKKGVGIVFICVKNYQIEAIGDLLEDLIDAKTIIVPLQNGVYSFEYFKKRFPNNVILEGFAQGPNTAVMKNIFIYQKPGKFHIGTSNNDWLEYARMTVNVMKCAGVESYFDIDIKHEVWKKLMLNVAGNAITALTGVDYCMFGNSPETQQLCVDVMDEFSLVANAAGIRITDKDIKDTLDYFLSFKVSKKTSMLEDVTNLRPTENAYIAGYISGLAKKEGINVPHIDTLYSLVKIKEDVYLKKI